ncbi:IS3 family transposase [Nonomuraea sp. NPDC050663]|uniref:IS3 family transposase n=1 Tax=Nonomuraea sp. NPDC050663 TaxID=3364370 RepID=UPI0037A19A65
MARLMRELGLAGRYRRRRHRTTIPDLGASSRPDLIGRDFTPDADGLDARWCGDITYIAAEEGWLYLATVIDVASRRVVGWATADHLFTDLVAEALRQAWTRRRPTGSVIFHSDKGCQYTSADYSALASRLGVRLSVGRTGQCWDKALAESFFATLKTVSYVVSETLVRHGRSEWAGSSRTDCGRSSGRCCRRRWCVRRAVGRRTPLMRRCLRPSSMYW